MNKLIAGMAAACRWAVESGKLMYPSTFGHVPTSVYMSHRLNEPFVPKQRGSSTCLWYTVGGNMSDKNLEQRINIKVCLKIGISASETLALLTVVYGEYAMKKSSF
jgi:hypothetical protein